MKTLREYLERNNYSIVKSLAEMLSISPEEATDFYKSISTFDEGKVVDALKDDASDDEKMFVNELFKNYLNSEMDESAIGPEDFENAERLRQSHEELKGFGSQPDDDEELDEDGDAPRFEIKSGPKGEYEIWDNKKGQKIDSAWSGHEAHNLLYAAKQSAKREVEEAKDSKPNFSQMAGKAKAGGYDPARELSKGQYQHRVIQNKAKKNDRAGQKSQLKRGVYENTVVPVLVNDDGYRFKIVESSLVANMDNIEAIFESSIVVSPIGGLTAVPGVGMNSLRKMAGISQVDAVSDQPEITEIESPDLNNILAIIDYMDETSKAALINLLTNPQPEQPSIDAEQLAMVKNALCDFGSALQCWIESANGGLDFLCPLVDSLWVKYNEC